MFIILLILLFKLDYIVLLSTVGCSSIRKSRISTPQTNALGCWVRAMYLKLMGGITTEQVAAFTSVVLAYSWYYTANPGWRSGHNSARRSYGCHCGTTTGMWVYVFYSYCIWNDQEWQGISLMGMTRPTIIYPVIWNAECPNNRAAITDMIELHRRIYCARYPICYLSTHFRDFRMLPLPLAPTGSDFRPSYHTF